MSEDEDDAHQMPAQLSFDWNASAVASFVHKFNGVDREGIDFPQFFGPFQPCEQGFKQFQFELLRMLSCSSTEPEICGKHNATTAVAKDHSSLYKLVVRLTALTNEPWVQALLQHGEPLPNKLVKITFSVHGKPQDVIDIQHPLIH